ncbi:hypothetical protein [Leifsonia xyli]|uniref:hypothetical protein n=1 Tax=Leifsonia xyli TaxID=1575 RepID=UPI003D67FDA6
MDYTSWIWAAFGLFVYFGPLLVVVAVLVGGVLLGCVIVAVVGAIRTGVTPPEETRDVDVAEFFEEQRTAAVAAGRNDSI